MKYLRPLSPLITAFHTHKMAIVYRDHRSVTSLRPTYSLICVIFNDRVSGEGDKIGHVRLSVRLSPVC